MDVNRFQNNSSIVDVLDTCTVNSALHCSAYVFACFMHAFAVIYLFIVRKIRWPKVHSIHRIKQYLSIENLYLYSLFCSSGHYGLGVPRYAYRLDAVRGIPHGVAVRGRGIPHPCWEDAVRYLPSLDFQLTLEAMAHFWLRGATKKTKVLLTCNVLASAKKAILWYCFAVICLRRER